MSVQRITHLISIKYRFCDTSSLACIFEKPAKLAKQKATPSYCLRFGGASRVTSNSRGVVHMPVAKRKKAKKAKKAKAAPKAKKTKKRRKAKK